MAVVFFDFRLVNWPVAALEGIGIDIAAFVHSEGHGYGDQSCHGAHCQSNVCG